VNTATAATVKTIRRENNNDEGYNGDGNHDGRDNLFQLWCWRQLAEIWWCFWRGEKRGKFAQIMVIVNFVMLLSKKKCCDV
jgi:hypothetical protein